MKKYIKDHGVKLGIIVLAAILLVLISTGSKDGKAGFLTNLVGSARTPVQRAASSISELFDGVYGYLYKYDSLKAENDALRIQLADAQSQVRAAADANEENKRLRELLKFAEKHTDYVFEAAKIVSWNSSNWESSFTISKGTNQGIKAGSAVITEYGAFVGVVHEVGDNWATIRTIIDVGISVGVLVGADGTAGMAVGDYGLMKAGEVKLTYLAEGAQMFKDDSILTSGKGGLIPQGLNIGKVSTIKSEASGQIEYGVIKPDCVFSELVQVYIIKEFNVVE